MRTQTYLSLGSNIGNRAENLNAAITQLRNLGEISAVSSFYETEPVECTAQPWFLNCVVKMETELTPQQLLARILEIERSMGRHRLQKKGPRNIDIDILLFGDLILETDELTIPHPALHQRRFVLEPLAEIALDLDHAVLHRSISELLEALPSGQTVRKAGEAQS